MVEFRKAHDALRPVRFLSGDAQDGPVQIAWYREDGEPMGEGEWNDPERKSVMVYLARPADPALGEEGLLDQLLMVFNAGDEREYALPQPNGVTGWKRALDVGGDNPSRSRMRRHRSWCRALRSWPSCPRNRTARTCR